VANRLGSLNVLHMGGYLPWTDSWQGIQVKQSCTWVSTFALDDWFVGLVLWWRADLLDCLSGKSLRKMNFGSVQTH
jgi:hypothetical protein